VMIGSSRFISGSKTSCRAIRSVVAGVYRTAVSPSMVSVGGGDHDVLVSEPTTDNEFVDLAASLVDTSRSETAVMQRAPVHDVLATIDEAFLVQANERFANGARHAVVHGEYSRDQSTDAPRRFIWSRMRRILLPPFQTRAMKPRAKSRRSPSAASGVPPSFGCDAA